MIVWLQVLKTAHIVGAGVVFGGGLAIAFFTAFGVRASLRSGSIEALRTVLRYTVTADAWLTAPAVAFQAASGAALMAIYRWPLDSPWAIAVGASFVLAGVFWIPVLWIQARLHRLSREARATVALPPAFRRLLRWWCALGALAFGAVIALYWLMVAKPLVLA